MSPKSSYRSINFDERFLGNIKSVLVIPDKAICDIIDLLLVFLYQTVKGTFFTKDKSFYQLCVISLHLYSLFHLCLTTIPQKGLIGWI
jgi:hypothetical protein